MLIAGFVVSAQRKNSFSCIARHNSSWISNICYIARILDNQQNDGARSAPILHFDLLLLRGFICDSFNASCLDPHLLCLLKTFSDCFARIFNKHGLLNHKVVEVVSQEVSAGMSSMPIVNSKERTSGPHTFILFVLATLRFWNVQNYWHAIFVVISEQTLVSVGRITSHHTHPFHWSLRLFK